MSLETAAIMVRAAAVALERVGTRRAILWAEHLRNDLKTLSLMAQTEDNAPAGQAPGAGTGESDAGHVPTGSQS